MYPSCLTGLVGLTHRDSTCLDGDYSNTSSLNLYITQDPAYDACRLRGGDTECELFNLMGEMREEAYRKVTVDVGAMLKGKAKQKQNVHYFIGQNEKGAYYAPHLVPSNPSLEIITEDRKGAYIRIDKIALMITPLAGAITVPIRLYKVTASGLVLLHTFDFYVESFNKTPVEVVSYTIPCDGAIYRVEYTYDEATMQVPDSNYHCGCGDKLKQSRGFIFENVSKTYGLSLYVTMFCEDGRWVCALLEDYDYRNVLAMMIRKLTISLLIQKIHSRQEINRFSMLTPEDATAMVDAYNLEYASRLDWLSEQRDFNFDGFCLQCDNRSGRKFNMLTGR